MSESTGTASPAAPTEGAGEAALPAPDTRPELSVSDAARLLRNARRAQAAPPAMQQADQAPGYGHNSGEVAPQPQSRDQTSPPGERGSVPSGVAALEAALGLERPAPQQQDSAPASMPAEIELEGRRWSQQALAEQIRLAADYTQKTQALAAQARELQAQQAALAQFLPYIQPEVEALQRRLADAPRPDPQLRQTDPATYWDQLAQWQDAQIEHQRVLAIQSQQAQAREAAVSQAVEQANQELAQKYPFWSDPQQRREIQQDIISWARTQGYTDQELHGLTSAKYLETLFKASLYDKYQSRIRTQAPAPQVRESPGRGAAPPPPPAARITQAQEAFDARPNINNAAALIAARRAPRSNGHSQW